jgi:hypothetical protein
MGRQREGDAQRQWQQAEGWAHADIRWAETVVSLPHPSDSGNAALTSPRPRSHSQLLQGMRQDPEK